MWKEVRIDNWQHYNQIISQLNPNDWIFRGQSWVEWKIQTSLHRELLKFIETNNEVGVEIERKMRNEFLSSFHLYSSYLFKEPLDEDIDRWIEYRLEVLATMQHYGSPTRLLDWTHSPYIATFFALDGATGDFCIYALNTCILEKCNKEMFGSAYNHRKNLAFYRRGTKDDFVFPYEPRQKNERLRKQQGLFLVPSVTDKSLDELLENYKIKDGMLQQEEVAFKYIFSKEHILDYWMKLKQMNITHETIYPGFEGFCKSLKLNILNYKK
ncbi:FRG domain-containing protein [Priestia aryabhattai]|uniref:FRG domain-containing protein n=1 Tax=Priestia aryabhattai TaxID=412384 RepID=UPI00203A51DA|nr:FRG domain-containing protein [Priestia aryabhattai]MCM2978874.1 FRG domain-containing protein [Priestia aryabhattai]